jgi:hypothetical protein
LVAILNWPADASHTASARAVRRIGAEFRSDERDVTVHLARIRPGRTRSSPDVTQRSVPSRGRHTVDLFVGTDTAPSRRLANDLQRARLEGRVVTGGARLRRLAGLSREEFQESWHARQDSNLRPAA